MRNLKRALSLTLASVMLLGMMVVGTSAAKSYPDVTEEENIEAIEVLQAVGVMEGDNNGNFNPDDYVTREQMAVIMSKLLNLDYAYYQGTNPFSDVPAWAAPYVAACAANGITSGIGGGMYGAGQNVNAVQAALMMLKALGYFQYQEDFGDSYILATVKQATEVGLFDKIDSNAQSALTRNEVAQMALNALQSEMVNFTGDVGTKIPTAQGDVLVGYKAEYTPRTSTEAKYHAIEGRTSDVATEANHKGQYYIQLGEELYNGELKLTKYDDDIFMRPSRHWEYKGQEIGTYMKKENIRETYTDSVNYRTLYDLLGRNNLNDYDFAYYVDGVLDSTVTAANILSRQDKTFGSTGRGVLTQVFVDIEKETIDITSIHTWLAKASSDYSTTRESVTLGVYTAYTNKKTVTTPKTVAMADVPEAEGVKQDDYVLVTMSGKDQANNVLEVVTIDDVEILTNSTLTKFSKGSDSDPLSDKTGHEAIFKSVTTGGTEYKNSNRAFYSDDVLELYNDSRLTDKTYNVYLDKYGYAIGVDLYAGEDNYVFITGFDLNPSAIATTNADANGIFLDGTQATMKINVRDTNKNIKAILNSSSSPASKGYFAEWNSTNYSDNKSATVNRWFTYTVKDNVYTLTPAVRMFTTNKTAAETIKCDSVVMDETAKHGSDTLGIHPATKANTRAYGNDDSIYITAELDTVSLTGTTNKVIAGVDGLYTGVQSVEIEVEYNHDASNNNKLLVDTDKTELYDSAYTLYDKNNYIIASVIVGEAKGTSANYAYILSAAKSEEIIDGTYYWEFEAVVDGAKTTLTVQSKFANTINSLMPGHVQELRYNGDYVTAIKNISADKFYTDNTAPINRNTHEVYDIGHTYTIDGVTGLPVKLYDDCRTAVDCKIPADTGADYTYPTSDRLNWSTTAPDLHFTGRTLYLKPNQAGDRGLTFVENAPAVLVQPRDGEIKSTNYSSVSEAISHVMDADGNTENGLLGFNGRIVAVLNSQGVAKWAVIISDTNEVTNGVNVPGAVCDIIVHRTLTQTISGTTVNTKLSDITLKKAVPSSGVWTIYSTELPVVTGATPFPAQQTVPYEKGTRVYEIDWSYVNGAGHSNANAAAGGASATDTVAAADGGNTGTVTAETPVVNNTNNTIKVPVGASYAPNAGDKITVTVRAADAANGATVTPASVDLEYKNGAWTTGTATIRSTDNTTKTYTVSVDLSNVKTIAGASAGACVQNGGTSVGDGTAAATIAGNNINVKITNGTTPFAAKNKFTITLTAPAKGALSASSVDVEYDGTSWTATPDKVTATAQDGSKQEYTVAVTTGASGTVGFTATASAGVDTGASMAVTSSTTKTEPAATPGAKGQIKVALTSKFAAFQDADSILVRIAGTGGCTVSDSIVELVYTAASKTWSSKDVTVTAPDGTTAKIYTVVVDLKDVKTITAGASTSDAALGNVSATVDADAKTITVACDGTAAGSETITVTVGASDSTAAVDHTSVSVTSTAGGGGAVTWATDHAKVTVTAQDGSTDEYTVVVPS